MELERAFETLGLAPGASAQAVEAAYRQLCDDFDARIGRVTSLALRERYAAARAELEAARAAALPVAGRDAPPAPDVVDPRLRSWAVLGLEADASPLEVASAYVSLCEELDRELDSAPTEALRRRCLEARAEIDTAYQHCTAPLAGEAPRTRGTDPGRYETQMAEGAFEVPLPEPEPDPAPPPMTLQVIEESRPPPRRQRRRRPLRRVLVAVALLLGAAVGIGGYGWWAEVDWPTQLAGLQRYLPLQPPQGLVDARSGAEYLRRRVAEERRDIQQRVELANERVARLEAEAAEAALAAGNVEGVEGELPLDPEGQAGIVLEEARARSRLVEHLAQLTESHVFSSSELAEAYGHIQLGAELATAGETHRAVEAFSAAQTQLRSTLRLLDEAETALGARSEALSARDAWVALAASAGLEAQEQIVEGVERLQEADLLLEQGSFAEATPSLRRASRHFRTALERGRRAVAARREELEEAQRVARAEAEARAQAELRREAERLAVARLRSDHSAAGEGLPRDRAAVKLVTIPAGAFFFGCNGLLDGECPETELPGRRVSVDAYRIDRTEVRVSEYGWCAGAGVCTEPATGTGCNWQQAGRGDHPVNCVDWEQAATYCEWVGKRLPTEEEWEKAARGTDGRTYPWGNELASCDIAVMSASQTGPCEIVSTEPVGSRDRGRSPYGLFDMAGNVLEWTASLHESGTGMRVLRGGSWKNEAGAMRASQRQPAPPSLIHESIGFRCAQGAVVAGRGVRAGDSPQSPR